MGIDAEKALEIAKVLVSPTEKLITTISGAIGKAYEPRHIRKMAQADADRIRLIGQAMRENSDIPITYQNGDISLDTTDFDMLVKRMQSRLAFQELSKQQNIEAVADNAYAELEGVSDVSNEPVDQDWTIRFFNSVEDISNEQMQVIWGKILAGEIRQPGSFSLRTMNVLRNLSRSDAEAFKRLVPLVMIVGETGFVTSDRDILHRYGINYSDIELLDDCGLTISNGMISLKYNINASDEINIYNKDYLISVSGSDKNSAKVSIGIYSLTKAGLELLNVLDIDEQRGYVLDFSENIFAKNPANVSVYKIRSIHDAVIDYEDEPVKVFQKP